MFLNCRPLARPQRMQNAYSVPMKCSIEFLIKRKRTFLSEREIEREKWEIFWYVMCFVVSFCGTHLEHIYFEFDQSGQRAVSDKTWQLWNQQSTWRMKNEPIEWNKKHTHTQLNIHQTFGCFNFGTCSGWRECDGAIWLAQSRTHSHAHAFTRYFFRSNYRCLHLTHLIFI